MARKETQYKVSGYDGHHISGSSYFNTLEEAQEDAKNDNWLDSQSDVVILAIAFVTDGRMDRQAHEEIVEVVKGTEQPFLKGIEVRNEENRRFAAMLE